MNTQSSILLIGSGRLATHFKHWFNLLSPQNIKLSSWSRDMGPESLNALIRSATHIWLVISDDQIIPFYEKNLKPSLQDHQTVVHFSGSVFHKQIACAHPLMTFSSQTYSFETYNRIQFALFDQKKNLGDLLPGFTNSCFQVLPEHKELYHALCVVTGNLPQLIWSKSLPLAENLNIPATALHNYIETVSRNFILLGPQAVTGPLVRKDLKTLTANLNSLKNKSSDLHSIYKSFIPAEINNNINKDLL